ncbi:hypothetical protein F1559_001142 [Cyanidiococcus yangmingshanensis]|uniref:Uncharacterized protein n=1 Tax=Cyanidiococcus yangmingshanensis TaxID=2690220 RepID=A0A7J7IMA1_9RHOD|nr:hypothetical protein F1559_001142 [Cyanidiococcus yangmingshanensis]
MAGREREQAGGETSSRWLSASLGRLWRPLSRSALPAPGNEFMGAPDWDCRWTTWFYVYFMSIATVLGTGVLGLPVSLYRCGIGPFLAFFTVTAFAESCAVVIAVELLQRTQAHTGLIPNMREVAESKASDGTARRPSGVFMEDKLAGTTSSTATSSSELHFFGPYAATAPARSRGASAELDGAGDAFSMEPDGAAMIALRMPHATDERHRHRYLPAASDAERAGAFAPERGVETNSALTAPWTAVSHETPSLPVMARLFFKQRWLRLLFEAAVYLHFISIMISYGLAGPQAYGSLFRSSSEAAPKQALAGALIAPKWSIALFCLGGTALLVFFLSAVLPVLTIATGLKATLLVVIVLVVGILGAEIANPWHNQASAFLEPFLMGTVALGGLTTVMPVTYARLGGEPSARGVRRYRAAVIAGLGTCYLLNVVWCISVLAVVPQTAEDWSNQIGNSTGPSLEMANAMGEISTVPLIAALERYHAKAAPVVAVLVNIFITISITVSFLVIGSGLRHMIDGVAIAWASAQTRHQCSTSDEDESIRNGGSNRRGRTAPAPLGNDGPAEDHERDSAQIAGGSRTRSHHGAGSRPYHAFEKRPPEVTHYDADEIGVAHMIGTSRDLAEDLIDQNRDGVVAEEFTNTATSYEQPRRPAAVHQNHHATIRFVRDTLRVHYLDGRAESARILGRHGGFCIPRPEPRLWFLPSADAVLGSERSADWCPRAAAGPSFALDVLFLFCFLWLGCGIGCSLVVTETIAR